MTMNDTTPSDAQADIVRATKRGRWLSAALMAVAIALLLPFMFIVLPVLNSGFNPMPSPPQVLIIKGILVCLAALGVATGAITVYSGRRMLRSGQCPPPDAWVWRDTKVKRGLAATRLAWAYIVSAVACGILCVGLVAYILMVLDRVRAPSSLKLPPGVKIIQQKSFSTGK